MRLIEGAQRRFWDRFEFDGQGYVFREDDAKAGYHITKDEFEHLNGILARRRIMFWLSLPFTIVMAIALTVLVFHMTGSPLCVHSTLIASVYGFPASVAAWARSGPRALVRGREPSDGGLAKAEIRRRRRKRRDQEPILRKLTWTAFLVLILAPYAFDNRSDASIPMLSRLLILGFFLRGIIQLVNFCREAERESQRGRSYTEEPPWTR